VEERDKERKRVERSNNREDYKKICELLKISSAPKNTLAKRILQAVEALVEQREPDLQHRLEDAEAKLGLLRGHLANCKCSRE